MAATSSIERIIFFDGVCNLCTASVQFIIKRDRKRKFRFASLQSDYAKNLLKDKHNGSGQTIVLIKGDNIFLRSDAAIEISRDLDGLWPIAYSLKIIPRFIRDGIYNFISRNRYRWFGKADTCWLPSADLQSRFVG